MSAAEIMRSYPPEPPLHHGSLPADPIAQVRTKYVRVTNKGDIPFTDRHDGVPVRIDPGHSDNLPLDIAAHFFGYYDDVSPQEMFRHVCKRQGWNTPEHIKKRSDGSTLSEELFSKLDIKPVVYKLVEETVDTESPIPADPEVPVLAADELPELPELSTKRKTKAS